MSQNRPHDFPNNSVVVLSILALFAMMPASAFSADPDVLEPIITPTITKEQCNRLDRAIKAGHPRVGFGDVLAVANVAAAAWQCRLPETCRQTEDSLRTMVADLDNPGSTTPKDEALLYIIYTGYTFLDFKCDPEVLLQVFENLSQSSFLPQGG